jgi:hypothetical protein
MEKRLWPNLNDCLRIYLVGLRKIIAILSDISRYTGQVLNRVPSIYKSEAQPACSVKIRLSTKNSTLKNLRQLA